MSLKSLKHVGPATIVAAAVTTSGLALALVGCDRNENSTKSTTTRTTDTPDGVKKTTETTERKTTTEQKP